MSAKQIARSLLVKTMLSPTSRAAAGWCSETRRRVLGQPHRINGFLQLDDPYSYLLSCWLPGLLQDYDIELCLYLSESRGGEFQPAAGMLAEYAIEDCRRLARELGVPFLDRGDSPPVEHRLAMLDALASCQGAANFNDELLQALSVYWRGDAEAASRRHLGVESHGAADAVISKSQSVQRRLGHYSSATLCHANVWYWGIDRMPYLLERLHALGVARDAAAGPRPASLRQAMQFNLPIVPPNAAKQLPPLELFYSFRSPYSYLLLPRICKIADAFGLALRLRPVLPIVMRGMPLPRLKQFYILRDAKRVAEFHGMDFGNIRDPLGRGVERCHAVFHYAEARQRGRNFLLHAGAAIWSLGIDVASDAGLKKVVAKTGLDWRDVETALDDNSWRVAAEENRESMMASGAWGVPTIRLGDFIAWGQDRDWLLVRRIEELCDSGDGILI
ncbi:MAG: 2-hydroxychromene-2-carboxylate isomerase [Woeseiaceae bacterium]|nr:2-hydroxychromene-2-carboxylate isomerase [Woeseiaceae bacterium]